MAPGATQANVTVRVTSTDGGLGVSFRWPDGGAPGSRWIPAAADCEASAEAVAVVVATWAGATLPDAAPVDAAVRAPAPPREARDAAGILELSTAGVLDARAARPGARVEAGGGAARGLGWLVAVVATTEQSVALGPARSLWTRPTLAAAARYRLARGAWRAQVDAGPAVSMTVARGRGYDVDGRSTAFDVGAAGGGRVGAGGPRTWVWLDARAAFWSRQQRLVNDVVPAGAARTAALPRVDVHVSVGVSVALP